LELYKAARAAAINYEIDPDEIPADEDGEDVE
jgi:hypothetical protein